MKSGVERTHVVACKRQRQDEVAAQITTALNTLDAHRAAIDAKRKEIDELIDSAVGIASGL